MEVTDQKARLDQDLQKKLDLLYALLKQPSLHLSQRFDEIINWIDYDAERILHELEKKAPACNKESVAKTNEARVEFIRILKAVEGNLLKQLPTGESGDDFESLEKRVKEFLDSPDSDINGLEDTYVQLALEILDQIHQQEKKIFDNQTFVYQCSRDPNKLGSLVHLTDVCLSKEEIDIMRYIYFDRMYATSKRMQRIHEVCQESLNKSLVVSVSQPLIADRKLVTFEFCLHKIGDEKSEEPLFFRSSNHDKQEPSLIRCGFDEQQQAVYQVDTRKLNQTLFKTNSEAQWTYDHGQIEGLGTDLQTNEMSYLQLKLNDNRLRSLASDQLPFFSCFTRIELENNQLESLNEDLLAKCTRLNALKLSSSCLPDTPFSLNFLQPLAKNLRTLELTLPPSTKLDLSIFSQLTKLEILGLSGPASQDANREHLKLETTQLSEIFGLQFERLILSYFDLPVISEETFKGMDKLVELRLTHWPITRIHPEAFRGQLDAMFLLKLSSNQIAELPDKLFSSMPNLVILCLELNKINRLGPKCFSGLAKLQELNLRGNRIKDLPPGVFDELVTLHQLNLACNKISKIKSGVLDKLAKLAALTLDHNPIADLDGEEFRRLAYLELLSLSHCKLRSIRNGMFLGLTKLRFLYLDHNSIGSFQVLSPIFSMEIDNANLSYFEHRMVQLHFFRDLSNLDELSLEGNKFKKLDLNCFANCLQLYKLDLSSNQLNEINTQIYGETLGNISKLNLSNNQLTHLSNNAFIGSYQLNELNLSGNKIQRLDQGFLSPFPDLHYFFTRGGLEKPFIYVVYMGPGKNRNHSIKQLDIKQAERADFYPSIATSWANTRKDRIENGVLDKLELQNTQPQVVQTAINSIEKHQPFAKVRKLYLIKCSLQNLDDLELVTRFPNLVKLDVSKNLLDGFKTCWLSGCPNLEYLDASSNVIETLDDANLFSNVPLLAFLNLSGNRLQSINRRLLHGLFKLKKLDLSQNIQLSVLDEGLFRSLLGLQEINLSGNNIARLNLPRLFKSCRNLGKLDLSSNQLDGQSVNEASMAQFINLKELKLSHNQLEGIEFLKVLPRLERLELSHNRIDAIVKDNYNYLGRMVNLQHLDLSGNLIRSLTKDMFAHLEHKLVHLDISNNPCKADFIGELRLYDQQKAKERREHLFD